MKKILTSWWCDWRIKMSCPVGARERLIINPWIKIQKRGFFGFPLFLNDRHFSQTHTHTHTRLAQRNENVPRRSTSDVVGWVANGRVADVLVSVAQEEPRQNTRERGPWFTCILLASWLLRDGGNQKTEKSLILSLRLNTTDQIRYERTHGTANGTSPQRGISGMMEKKQETKKTLQNQKPWIMKKKTK